MNLAQLVAAVILKATGKPSSLSPADTKYQKILGIANMYIDQWSNTKNVDWSSLYEREHSIGTVSATNTFDLDDDIRKISDTPGDYVQVSYPGGDTRNNQKYAVVPADTLTRYVTGSKICAQIGRTLVFRDSFPADSSLIGGSIFIPVYLYPDKLTSPTSEVPIDIPQWLVLMTAAEYVRNDITKQNQYPNLVAEANEVMERMIDDNDAQVSTIFIGTVANGRTW